MVIKEVKKIKREEFSMKLTKEEAQEIARKSLEVGKKYGLPAKKKKKKEA